MVEDHIEALKEAGFDDADVIGLLTVVAQTAFVNTIADALNVLPSDQSAELEQYYPKEISVLE